MSDDKPRPSALTALQRYDLLLRFNDENRVEVATIKEFGEGKYVKYADVLAAWPTQAQGSRIELEWAQDGLEFVCIIPRQEYRVVHSIDEYSGETWRAYFDSYGPEQDGELAEELGVYAWAQDGRAACERHFTNSYQPYTHPSPSTAALREALRECADDLEAEINGRLPEDLRNQYERFQREYKRDMDPVERARTLLAGDK